MSSKGHIVEVQMRSIGKIAIIVPDNPPLLYVDPEKTQYEIELRNLLNEIGVRKLPVHLSPKEGLEKGKWTISDRYQDCSPGEENYEYALAHELSHHRIQGNLIRGIVKEPAGCCPKIQP